MKKWCMYYSACLLIDTPGKGQYCIYYITQMDLCNDVILQIYKMIHKKLYYQQNAHEDAVSLRILLILLFRNLAQPCMNQISTPKGNIKEPFVTVNSWRSRQDRKDYKSQIITYFPYYSREADLKYCVIRSQIQFKIKCCITVQSFPTGIKSSRPCLEQFI